MIVPNIAKNKSESKSQHQELIINHWYIVPNIAKNKSESKSQLKLEKENVTDLCQYVKDTNLKANHN